MRIATVTPEDFLAALAGEADLAVTLSLGTRVPPTWASGPRCFDEHVLYLVEAGAIAGTAGGRAVRVAAGEVLWTPAGIDHDYRVAMRSTDCHSLRFRLRRGGASLRPRETVLLDRQGADLRPCFTGIEGGRGQPHGEARCRGFLLALLGRLLAGSTGGMGFADTDLDRLRRYLARHASRNVTSADLAAELGYSTAHFTRRFRATLGISPRRWLVDERLRAAARDLCAGDESVAVIAARWGWTDAKLFSRMFRRTYGHPPSAWRRRW